MLVTIYASVQYSRKLAQMLAYTATPTRCSQWTAAAHWPLAV